MKKSIPTRNKDKNIFFTTNLLRLPKDQLLELTKITPVITSQEEFRMALEKLSLKRKLSIKIEGFSATVGPLEIKGVVTGENVIELPQYNNKTIFYTQVAGGYWSIYSSFRSWLCPI
jgi:hypothetical protein